MRIPKKYYLIALVEGAAVMSVELGGAKIIAPFYGTSLFVWSSVLAVTLGGLTLGYFFGGKATCRYESNKLLLVILTSATVLISLMPVLALRIMPLTLDYGVRLGSLVSAMSFMLSPLICLGMVSPVLIQLCNSEIRNTGRTAGTIYAISTVGGILMTLVMGFYLMNELGIRFSLFFTASLLALSIFALFQKNRGMSKWVTSGLVASGCVMLISFKPFSDPKLYFHFLHQSEGVLGQVSVLENPLPETNRVFRILFINNIPQTKCNVDFIPASGWEYPHRIATIASVKPRGSKALLIGMGGGNIAMELKKMGYSVDIVELDQRMPRIAKDYFGFDAQGIKMYIDDGRHYLKTHNEKYDLVITDVLNGETQPFHLFTKEAFKDFNKVLNKDALLIINFQGYLHGEHGQAARSIYKTLSNAGFKIKYYHNGSEAEDDDIHFVTTLGQLNFSEIELNRLNKCCQSMEFTFQNMFSNRQVDLNDAFLLEDDKPQLEIIGTYWNEKFRTMAQEQFLKPYAENGIPFFQ